MEARVLVVVVVVFVCGRLTDARIGSMRGPPYWAAKLQKPEEVEAKPVDPKRERSSLLARPAGSFHSKWIEPADDQFSWKFPEHPVEPVKKSPFQFKVQEPVVPNRVAVRCGESKIQVEVSQDLLGFGSLISPDEITLGGCPAKEVDDLAHVLVFESELHDCGSTLEIQKGEFVYYFMLLYKPKLLGKSPILRSQSVDVKVECHYMNLKQQ